MSPAAVQRKRQGSPIGPATVAIGTLVLWALCVGLGTPLAIVGGVALALGLGWWTRAADL